VKEAPNGAWRVVELDAPHRKFRHPKILDERIHLNDDYTPSSTATEVVLDWLNENAASVRAVVA
jgi:hypothetical protein